MDDSHKFKANLGYRLQTLQSKYSIKAMTFVFKNKTKKKLKQAY